MEANIGMNIKVENWDGHEIRFVEREPGDWWAVGIDVCKALNLKQHRSSLALLPIELKGVHTVDSLGGMQEVTVVNEPGIYRLVFKSRKQEAVQFQVWVYEMIRTLRKASGLEAFQIFRMLDKEHQKEAMRQLRDGLTRPVRVDFIKVNTIANKAVSTRHGYTKMLKKDDMTPDMLLERQPILDDTVALMSVNDSFGLGLSVSKAVYGKYGVQ